MGGNYWLTKAVLSTATNGNASFTLGGFLFTTGGTDSGGIKTAAHQKYNDSADTWTAQTSFSLGATTGLVAFNLSLGFAGYGSNGSNVATLAAYNEAANTWTTKTSGATARRNQCATNLNGYGYNVQGFTTVVVNTNERYDEVQDSWTTKAVSTITADENAVVSAAGYMVSVYGETTPGTTNTASSAKYSDVSDSWSTISASSGTVRSGPSGFNSSGIVNVATGRTAANSQLADNDRLDILINNWSLKAPNPTSLSKASGGSVNGNGYVIGGQTGSLNGTTTVTSYMNYHLYQVSVPLKRVTDTPRLIMTTLTIDGTPYNLPVQLRTDGSNWKMQVSGLVATVIKTGDTLSTVYAATGGYRNYEARFGIPKFISGVGGGFWLTRTAGTAKYRSAGISLNGMGYSVAGRDVSDVNTSTVHQYNDYTSTWLSRGSINNVKQGPCGFDLNGLGYAAGGGITNGATSNTVDQYNDETNVWTAKGTLNTAREMPSGHSLNGLGYAVGGSTTDTAGAPGGDSTANEQYSDSTNIWTAKATMTARRFLGSFAVNQFAYACTGINAAGTRLLTVEQFNDASNAWTAKTGYTLPVGAAGGIFGAYSFTADNKGYLAYGADNSVLVTGMAQYDDLLNLWNVKTSATGTARSQGSSFSLGSSGYTAVGAPASGVSTELNQYITNERFSQVQFTLDTVSAP